MRLNSFREGMFVNIDYYLKVKCEENPIDGVLRIEELYKDISNECLKQLFAIMHQKFNSLLSFMQAKKKSNGHYNAGESRELLRMINLYKDMLYVLKSTALAFRMDEKYEAMLNFCDGFLQESGGSAIPNDLPEFRIVEYAPIFFMTEVITIPSISKDYKFSLKLIGEGSYAKVFRYRDEFYNKYFVLKRAKDDLNEKEVERFKREFDVMNELKSPYVLEVYRYDEERKEYYMEYADETLRKFIDRTNDTLSVKKRRGIAMQIFRGFAYIHSKGYFHRDISFTNILLQHYENDLTIVKISDFGLVKMEQSDLTSFGSEIKGSLNDSNLDVVGFANYSIEYETFALTRLIYYVMTGRYSLEKIKNQKVKDFVLKGVSPNLDERYHCVAEMEKAFDIAFPITGYS